MAAGREEIPEKNRVLVAMDGSAQSELALNFYLETLSHPNDLVFVLHCPEIRFEDSISFPGAALSYDEVNRRIHELEDRWTERKEKYEQVLKSHKVHSRFEVTPTTSPGEVIVKRSIEYAAGLIVMGSRGHGALGRALYGSVSNYVLHHSHVPVAVCPHRKPH